MHAKVGYWLVWIVTEFVRVLPQGIPVQDYIYATEVVNVSESHIVHIMCITMIF